ncbi:MAG: hypothetical protein IKZ07_07225 [Akkermansia sp.]|nr:hypothetical protein [Akkermansia sp.]
MTTLADIYNKVSLFGDSSVPLKLIDAEADKTYKITWVACGETGITLYITPTDQP